MRKADPDPNKFYFRAGDRFVCHDGQWWFSVREGEDQGPYPSRQAAELALQRYIDSAEMLDQLKQSPGEKHSQPEPGSSPLSIDTSY